jgi:hypothetical protein
VASDWSGYFGHKITPTNLQSMLPRYRYTTYTTETAKKIANALDMIPGLHDKAMSPIHIEYIVRGWTGSTGKYILDISDFMLRKAGIVDEDLSATKTWADTPVVKRFIARSPSYAAKPIGAFYDKYIEMEQALKTWKERVKRGQQDEADALASEYAYTKIEPYAKAINALRKAVDATQRMPLDIQDADEKRALIDEYYRQMVLIANEGLYYMENAKPNSYVKPERYTASQRSAMSSGNEAYAVFSFLNTADQNVLLQHMTQDQRREFMPYARQNAGLRGYDPNTEASPVSPPSKQLDDLFKELGIGGGAKAEPQPKGRRR